MENCIRDLKIPKKSACDGLKNLIFGVFRHFYGCNFCLNFFGNEHFHLSILVECIAYRLEYLCGRLAVNFCFCNYRNVHMLLAKRLIYCSSAVLDVLRVQERDSTIRNTIKTSCPRGSGWYQRMKSDLAAVLKLKTNKTLEHISNIFRPFHSIPKPTLTDQWDSPQYTPLQ